MSVVSVEAIKRKKNQELFTSLIICPKPMHISFPFPFNYVQFWRLPGQVPAVFLVRILRSGLPLSPYWG